MDSMQLLNRGQEAAIADGEVIVVRPFEGGFTATDAFGTPIGSGWNAAAHGGEIAAEKARLADEVLSYYKNGGVANAELDPNRHELRMQIEELFDKNAEHQNASGGTRRTKSNPAAKAIGALASLARRITQTTLPQALKP
ncbi:hypothetical protein BX589_101126 [Paraburkholderia fungorum]|uniref:hypothetical protein n=1 Tax=Paraburkholderia fungorum TaxID=134537 RepID=UPI000D44A793|nr:hypothetical protein [Paraburkholderia fungorum]PRZ56476.1 hypothetical protein BX589_101126 [Paraburkholderia fungorum]